VSRSTFDVIPLKLAVMLLEPTPAPVARPAVLPPVLMVATAGFEDDHVTETVRSWLVPSLKTPTALNRSVVSLAIEGFSVLMVKECSTAAVTVSGRMFDVIPSLVALMLVEPTSTPNAEPVGLTVAAAVFVDAQVAEFVRSFVVPSLKVPVAVN